MKNFAYFFIDRPRFATVVSLIITLVGFLAFRSLQVAQFPEITPPTVVVRAALPGANPDVLANTIAAPIEQEVNGVEGMIYMNSQSTADGVYQLTVSFEPGTDLNEAQVLVQNRVSTAEPKLPSQTRSIGVTVEKSSPDLMMVVQMYSPDDTFDMAYVSNYALLQVRDELRRIEGVGEVRLFGGREYSMRIWLNPERMDFYKLTSNEVVAALRQQNVQVAAGIIGQEPQPDKVSLQLNVTTTGRLTELEEFENIIVKNSPDGRLVHLKDLARVELGSLDYNVNAYLGESRTVAIPIFQQPGSNALETAEAIRKTMDELSRDFPEGLTYSIDYDPTVFIDRSIDAVFDTLFEAVLLVVLVMIVFLQSWRAAIIPLLAIPVSLIGTFAVMQGLGFSINNLTLFGLVLAIGIVVDDAIVVVENIDRNLEDGLPPREATRKAMKEVSGALFATALVLMAVFIPTVFIDGITGQFFRQFAVTVATSTFISMIVSLSLSPALGVLILRADNKKSDAVSRVINFLFGWLFNAFNWLFDRITGSYGWIVRKTLRMALLMLLIYGALMATAYMGFKRVPGGFIPTQDQGYSIVAVQLPAGTPLQKTDQVARDLVKDLLKVKGMKNTVAFAGFNGATFSNAPNAVVIFTVFDDFADRKTADLTADAIRARLQQTAMKQDALAFVIPPPTVRGLGTGGGFKMEIQDRAGLGYTALEQATWQLAFAAMADDTIAQAFTPYTSASPQLFADIDREKAQMLGVSPGEIFSTLETQLGSSFVNELNLYGRTFRVTAQADAPYRNQETDITALKVRNNKGDMVPMGSFTTVSSVTGPDRVVRHNLYSSADLLGTPTPGVSTGQALAKMEQIARQVLPPGISYEWTELAYQEKKSGTSPVVLFTLSVVFVFLLLAAQYESWGLPLAVILTVPLCLSGAIWGVHLRGMDNNILTQIGIVVLIALASKNAILIIEFAKQLEDQGRDRFEAALQAAKLRFRPIVMTSFAFILGVVPLALATGAGAEMRQALGTVVFAGMLAVTMFGVFFAPLFYVIVRKWVKE
ncbi:MAG: multidrug efflux RND transporter permease subunit [Akkermansiaceae bacterium]|nr:multidrug efflux RND transporter permease subunit [Akkermansiaceae bacterium]